MLSWHGGPVERLFGLCMSRGDNEEPYIQQDRRNDMMLAEKIMKLRKKKG